MNSTLWQASRKATAALATGRLKSQYDKNRGAVRCN